MGREKVLFFKNFCSLCDTGIFISLFVQFILDIKKMKHKKT
jgi:hypothetical protein